MEKKPDVYFVEVKGNHSTVLEAIAGVKGIQFGQSLLHSKKHRKPNTRKFIDVNVISVSDEELQSLLASEWVDKLNVYRFDLIEEVLLLERKKTKIVPKTRTKVQRPSLSAVTKRLEAIEKRLGIK